MRLRVLVLVISAVVLSVSLVAGAMVSDPTSRLVAAIEIGASLIALAVLVRR